MSPSECRPLLPWHMIQLLQVAKAPVLYILRWPRIHTEDCPCWHVRYVTNDSHFESLHRWGKNRYEVMQNSSHRKLQSWHTLFGYFCKAVISRIMWWRLAVRGRAGGPMLLRPPLLFAQPTASLLRTLEITARVRTDNAPRTCGERIIFCHIKYFYNIHPAKRSITLCLQCLNLCRIDNSSCSNKQPNQGSSIAAAPCCFVFKNFKLVWDLVLTKATQREIITLQTLRNSAEICLLLTAHPRLTRHQPHCYKTKNQYTDSALDDCESAPVSLDR